MTPNEKELLGYFKDVRKANAVKMSNKMDLSPDYTDKICRSLVLQGYLKKVSAAKKYPIYEILRTKE